MLTLQNASVGKISTLADKTIKIELHCRELPEAEMAALFIGYMSGTEGITIKEPKVEGGKTKSERLRSVLFRYWENQTIKDADFDSWYSLEMEKIINHYKDKL